MKSVLALALTLAEHLQDCERVSCSPAKKCMLKPGTQAVVPILCGELEGDSSMYDGPCTFSSCNNHLVILAGSRTEQHKPSSDNIPHGMRECPPIIQIIWDRFPLSVRLSVHLSVHPYTIPYIHPPTLSPPPT